MLFILPDVLKYARPASCDQRPMGTNVLVSWSTLFSQDTPLLQTWIYVDIRCRHYITYLEQGGLCVPPGVYVEPARHGCQQVHLVLLSQHRVLSPDN